MERTWPLVDQWVGPRQWEAPHSLPCPWDAHSTHCSHNGSRFQGRSHERATCCWDHLDSTHDWTKVRPLHKLSRSWQGLWSSTYLVAPKVSLLCKFSCLLNLPTTPLEWLPLPPVSPGPHVWALVSDFTWRTPEVLNQQNLNLSGDTLSGCLNTRTF